MRLFYSKAGHLCQFFRGMNFLSESMKILCYNLAQTKQSAFKSFYIFIVLLIGEEKA